MNAPAEMIEAAKTCVPQCAHDQERCAYVVRGLPSKYRTTLAALLAGSLNGGPRGTLVMALRNGENPVATGTYAEFLASLHGPHVVLDGTHAEAWEISPYLYAAKARKYHVRIVTVHVPLTHAADKMDPAELRRLYKVFEPGQPFPRDWDRIDLDPTGIMSNV